MNVKRFGVRGLPPKKREWSIWAEKTEAPRVKALRLAALPRFSSPLPKGTPVTLRVRVYAKERGIDGGDLANFIGGICDALQAAHGVTLKRAKFDPQLWSSVPQGAQPKAPLVYHDDCCVNIMHIERRTPRTRGPRYVVEISWP